MQRKTWMHSAVTVALAAGALAMTAPAGTAITPESSGQSTSPDPGATPADAKAAAQAFVRNNAGALKIGRRDDVRRTGVQPGTDGTFYVSYERSYQELPVVGGDFVVVTHDGVADNASVAQDRKIAVDTVATVPAGKAVALARKQIDSVTSASDARQIVWAPTGAPRLAWEVVVKGTHEGSPSETTVYVDARSGTVLDSWDLVAHGTGNGNHVGQVEIGTSGSGSSYRMVDPANTGLQCGGQGGSAFTGTDDAWGNGSGTNLETACVDTLYAIQGELRMLEEWFGRDGIDGSGRTIPARVGLNDVNAYWNGSITNFGHNQANSKQATSIDVVGHEYGHGLFYHSGSGGSTGNDETGGMNESTGDILGALTEHYLDNPNDTPDYGVGEEVDLVGQGTIREMSDPSLKGHPNCYREPFNYEVHAGAGPQNHWFYLLAEGSADSPICSGGPASVTGLGIEVAGKIFYGALQQKTSYWNHKTMRVATLNAVTTLYPSDCAKYDAVKNAWNAVAVPAQAGEPGRPSTCGGEEPPPDPVETPDIDVTNVMGHLQQLQSIADSNGGNRAHGTSGYQASVDYVKGKLEAAGYTVNVQSFSHNGRTGYNVIADWPGGDTANTVMMGSHLDSVSSGAGINDNGSGSAGLLEVALQVAADDLAPEKHLRFGWWGAEELGLVGSKYYVNSLSTTQKSQLDGYLNFDMIGSINSGYFVYNDDARGTAYRDLLDDYFTTRGIDSDYVDVDGRSDHAGFMAAGIPTGGTFTGAEGRMTSAQAAKWDGIAGQAYDPCYHSTCDDLDNIATDALDVNTDAIAYMAYTLGGGDGGGNPDPDVDFTVSLSPSSGSVDAGGSSTSQVITAATSGTPGAITLTASGLPTGATATFDPASVQPGGSSTMTIRTTASTPAGAKSITVTGTAGSVVNTATYQLTVNTPDGGGSDCSDHQVVRTGSLSSGQQQVFGPFTMTGRDNTACLDGPNGTDFDLYLQYYNGWYWTTVKSATSSASDETLAYTGRTGTYRYVVRSYSGSGSFTVGFSNN